MPPSMPYVKAVEVENMKENTQEVLRALGGLTPEDAMNALGAAVAEVTIKNWPNPAGRDAVLTGWFSMVRSAAADIG
jgi:hypothetical protein